jgi:hypothetical protein
MTNKSAVIITFLVVLAVVAGIALTVWWFGLTPTRQGPAAGDVIIPEGDTTSDINEGLNQINLPDLDREFDELDSTINEL